MSTTPDIVEWADYIFVMEKARRNKLQKKYRKYLNRQRVICIGIPDDYEYMDEGPIRLLKHRIGNFFINNNNNAQHQIRFWMRSLQVGVTKI